LGRAKGCKRCCFRSEIGQTGFETGQTGLGLQSGKFGFRARQESRFVSGGRVLVVGLESQQVVSLLGVLPLVFNTGMGGVVVLRWRGGTIHGSPFVILVLL
jgi:hypothetical protein